MAEPAPAPIRGTYRALLVRYGELWLKGANRKDFIERVVANLRRGLSTAAPGCAFHRAHGWLRIELPDPAALAPALALVEQTPGLSWVCPVRRADPDLAAIEAAARALVAEAWAGATGSFAVDTRRTDKAFPHPSPAVNQALGAALREATGLTVDLVRPDRTLGVDIGADGAHLWAERRPGLGGMPVGTAGNVLLLLSGGIDSPVAGYLAQKRGCALAPVYFHSPPFVSEDSRTKVLDLARALAVRQPRMTLRVVPFTRVQAAIRDACNPRFAVILYRRFMYRIAHALAAHARCVALCTGESLAQVASQTLENLNLVDDLGPRLTLRPLLTYDKAEIIALADQIGTLPVSSRPFADCCTLFVPRNPITRGRLDAVLAEEAKLDVAGLVDAAYAGTENILI